MKWYANQLASGSRVVTYRSCCNPGLDIKRRRSIITQQISNNLLFTLEED